MKRLYAIIALLFFSATLFAQSIGTLLPQLSSSQLQLLQSGQILEGESFDEDLSPFLPKDSLIYEHVLAKEADPAGFTVVSIMLIPYPPKMVQMDQKAKQLELFNTMRSISTQEGITYISHRAGNKPKILVEKSWYLETPKSRVGLKDPVSTSLVDKATYYVYQRDSAFGSNIYQHNYELGDKEILVEVTNLESMRVLSLFKAVGPGQLSIAMSTYQTDEGLLLVASATITGRDPQVRVLGITVDLPSAFSRRTTSLAQWFIDQLNR